MFCKEDTIKESFKLSERFGISIVMLKKRERLEDFGFKRGLSELKRFKVEESKLFFRCINERLIGLLLNSFNL